MDEKEKQLCEAVMDFAEGSREEQLYQLVYEAKCRLNERLGTSEDTDIELIISSLLSIAQEVGVKMYRYGRES